MAFHRVVPRAHVRANPHENLETMDITYTIVDRERTPPYRESVVLETKDRDHFRRVLELTWDRAPAGWDRCPVVTIRPDNIRIKTITTEP